ncbi:ADP-ribosyltransferase [Streptomyces europaeiscabiei]|uniref:ADP-ribosyltransferase n=1 Tax=Streptomyces europaeiscabiei TaxID=146819 RepID=UPI0029BAF76E|nr:ADP-ribosyltransferase [Streptomyces europaeiscabiei]MDX3694941.1 ADP-ribosyltransferase [Streptomyces europaeiscabiei]
MCRAIGKGGRRCASSHPAVRVARRAAARTAEGLSGLGAEHPAHQALEHAKQWAAKTREAAESGDDAKAGQYAENAKKCAEAARTIVDGQPSSYPNSADPRHAYALGPMPAKPEPEAPSSGGWQAPQMPEFPEHVRAASALASASGAGGAATFIPREDGGQTVAWGGADFGGSATVYAGEGDEPPYARVVFNRLDQDRYQALANSPWPYRVENGQVIYDRVPADHAEQIINAAATRQAGRPWEQHGLTNSPVREQLDRDRAGALVPESKAWAARLSKDQRHWTQTYTTSKHKAINEHLYKGRDIDQPAERMDEPMREVVGNINSAIDSAGRSERPHHTFRGFTPPLEVRKSNQVAAWARANFPAGSRYRDASFMSSSHCPHVAAHEVFSRSDWEDDNHQRGRADHAVVFELVSRRGAAVGEISMAGNLERERLHRAGSSWVSVGVHENVQINGRNCVVVQLVDTEEVRRH